MNTATENLDNLTPSQSRIMNAELNSRLDAINKQRIIVTAQIDRLNMRKSVKMTRVCKPYYIGIGVSI